MNNDSLVPQALLARQDHRPWERPRRPWIMAQSWCNLLFAHWVLPADLLQPLLPSGLTLDTYDGQAWLAVVPFHMRNIRPRGVSPLPYVSAFPELNVRTYVTDGQKAGVWFLSLDAMHRLAVETARTTFHLPYFMAQMAWRIDDDNKVHYDSIRTDKRTGAGEFHGWYRPTSEIYYSQAGTLEHWLTERYCLYASQGKRLYRGEIHHLPWGLQQAEAEITCNTVTEAHGITLPDDAPLLHYVDRLDILAWQVKRIQ